MGNRLDLRCSVGILEISPSAYLREAAVPATAVSELLSRNRRSTEPSASPRTRTLSQSYVRGWGERVVAGQPTAAEREEAERRIRECRLKYLQTAADVSAAMEAKLRNAVDGHVLWYDDKIFSLLTDVMSEEAQDGLVQNVKVGKVGASEFIAMLCQKRDGFRIVARPGLFGADAEAVR